MFPMCLFNWRKIMQREKWKTMDVILVILAIFLLVFVIAMIAIYIKTGGIPDTLCTCVFSVCGGECGVMGWIKTTKDRHLSRQYELEDRETDKKIMEETCIVSNPQCDLLILALFLLMVAVLVLTRYVLPWVKSKVDSEKLNLVAQWAYKAVLMAQQTMKATGGKEKKAIVTQFLKEILQEKNIALSDKQIEILIEAAVKQMKIQENLGIVIEATDDVEV